MADFQDMKPLDYLHDSLPTSNFHLRDEEYSDDDDDYGLPSQQTLSRDHMRRIYRNDKHWIFTTPEGWLLFFANHSIWFCGWGIAQMIADRTILWSGYLHRNYTSHTELVPMISAPYEGFSLPLTTLLLELLTVHGLLLSLAILTRLSSDKLAKAGCHHLVAPFSNQAHDLSRSRDWASILYGGIAGRGIFEFETDLVREAIPTASLYAVFMIVNSIMSAKETFLVYILPRIFVVPCSLIINSTRRVDSFSIFTILSFGLAMASLLIVITTLCGDWLQRDLFAGLLSSALNSVYLDRLQKVHASWLNSKTTQDISRNGDSSSSEVLLTRQESRGVWALLHYISIISIIIVLVSFIFSSEAGTLYTTYRDQDFVFYWFMIICGGSATLAVFCSTLIMVTTSSPPTTAFLYLPRYAILIPIMARSKIPLSSWILLGLCIISCLWYLYIQLKDQLFSRR